MVSLLSPFPPNSRHSDPLRAALFGNPRLHLPRFNDRLSAKKLRYHLMIYPTIILPPWPSHLHHLLKITTLPLRRHFIVSRNFHSNCAAKYGDTLPVVTPNLSAHPMNCPQSRPFRSRKPKNSHIQRGSRRPTATIDCPRLKRSS